MANTISAKILMIPVGEITPYERNARAHAEADVSAIAKSIQEFGFNDPIGVWGKKNIIVEGHGRLLAAKQLGMTEVPCIRLDHLTDEQRRAYALAHNKTAELSAWDTRLLKEELSEILDQFDMAEFGFQEAELDLKSNYIDDFFDRGIEAKEKATVLGVKVVCGTREQVDEVMTMLSEAGYSPEEL